MLGGDNGVATPELWTTGWSGETQDSNMEQNSAQQLQTQQACTQRCLTETSHWLFGLKSAILGTGLQVFEWPNYVCSDFKEEKVVLLHANQQPYH